MKIFSTGWSENFDGPGLRWIIYLKGCNFHCAWCASPESVSHAPDLLFYPERAEHADRACPHGAVKIRQKKWNIDRNACISCVNNFCTNIWKHTAFERVGMEISVSDLVKQACEYRSLFGKDGGVTFGGGEPTLQFQEVLQALSALRKENIHTAMETNASSPELPKFFNKVDLLICDLKCVSPELHKKWIRADNKLVLKNLENAAEKQKDLLIRIPFITGMNDNRDEMERMVKFLKKLAKLRKRLDVQVLRLHHLGEPKYHALDKQYKMKDVPSPTKNAALKFIKKMQMAGINANLG